MRGAKMSMLGLGAVLLLASGCAMSNPRMATDEPVPADQNAELIVFISDQPYVTAEAGYRAIHVLCTGAVFDGDYAALQSDLIERDVVARKWGHHPDECLDRAAVGYMVARAVEIRTGLNWQLFGLGRYAWRELIYRGIAHPGSEYNLVSGGEFLGILARAEEFRFERGQPLQERAELGNEPG